MRTSLALSVSVVASAALVSTALLAQAPLTTTNQSVTLQSSYRRAGEYAYDIKNSVSIQDSRLNGAMISWLSAGLTTGSLFQVSSPQKPCELTIAVAMLLGTPIPYDAADLLGVTNSVNVSHPRVAVAPFDAPAYAPPDRIFKEVAKDFYTKFPVGEILKFITTLVSGDVGFELSTTVRRVSQGKYEYRYLAQNNSGKVIKFQWTSVLAPKYPNGLEGMVDARALFETPAYAGGEPVPVNDVVILAEGQLPRLEVLRDTGTWSDRIRGGFDGSGETIGLLEIRADGPTVARVPALVPREWVVR